MSIFISYRRAESETFTGRMYDRLITDFGKDRVFRDIDSLPVGKPFPAALEEAIARANVALILIGPTWASCSTSDGSKRLFEPEDHVRREVEKALSAGIPVIPILLQGARMPDTNDLPPTIHPLRILQGLNVRSDPDFHKDMDRLIANLKPLLKQNDQFTGDPDIDRMALRYGTEIGEIWFHLYLYEKVPEEFQRPSVDLIRIVREWNDRAAYLGLITADPNLLRSIDFPELFLLATRLLDLRRSRIIELGYRLIQWWKANNAGPEGVAFCEPHLLHAIENLERSIPNVSERILYQVKYYQIEPFSPQRYAALVEDIICMISR